MQIFSENDLDFSFPNNWHVIKLDDHEFYRRNIEPIGANLKSVDFLIKHNDTGFDKLLLIEVKDFRGYAAANRKRQANGELIQEIIEKALHSITINYLGHFNQIPEFKIINTLTNNSPNEINLILFLEEDNSLTLRQKQLFYSNSLRNNIEIKIKQRLWKNASIKFRILSREELRDRDEFKVN